MEEPPGVRELIAAAISEESGETIRPGYSAELDEARGFRDGAHEWLTRFEAEERLKTGLKTLKVGYRDGEGYFIEVAGKDAASVPERYQHRKALKHNARYVTVELKEHESRCSRRATRSSASSGGYSARSGPPSRRPPPSSRRWPAPSPSST
jgi:DNA mismatch repair protein MutS